MEACDPEEEKEDDDIDENEVQLIHDNLNNLLRKHQNLVTYIDIPLHIYEELIDFVDDLDLKPENFISRQLNLQLNELASNKEGTKDIKEENVTGLMRFRKQCKANGVKCVNGWCIWESLCF